MGNLVVGVSVVLEFTDSGLEAVYGLEVCLFLGVPGDPLVDLDEDLDDFEEAVVLDGLGRLGEGRCADLPLAAGLGGDSQEGCGLCKVEVG